MIPKEELDEDEDIGKPLKKDLVFSTPYKLKLKLPENSPKVFLTVFDGKYFVEYQKENQENQENQEENQKNQENQESQKRKKKEQETLPPYEEIEPLIEFLIGLEARYNSGISEYLKELEEQNHGH